MSKTPLTDKNRGNVNMHFVFYIDPEDGELVKAEFAEQLEIKLNKAREQISTLMHQQAAAMQELQEKWHTALKQRDTLVEALHSIRHRLGDFQEPWNSRETYIDKIAHQALAAVKGGGK
jgi:uncharacterized protein YbgA (DUF1722 family)